MPSTPFLFASQLQSLAEAAVNLTSALDLLMCSYHWLVESDTQDAIIVEASDSMVALPFSYLV